MIYFGNITSINSISKINNTTAETTNSIVKDEEFIPTHTPAGAFLFALYNEGLIDSNYKIIKDKFKNIPFFPFNELQIQALQAFFKNKSFHISIDSNIYGSSTSMDVKADCKLTLDELNIHLQKFALERFGINLNHPILVGGYLRYTILSSLDYCQSAFASAGLPNVKDSITQSLINATLRSPPDADIKYMIPDKTPKTPLKSKDNLYEFTAEVVKYIAKKMNKPKTIFSDWTLAKNSLAHFYVIPPINQSLDHKFNSSSEISQIKETQNNTVLKIRRFGLVSFPKSPAFKVDIVFDKLAFEGPNLHEDHFYNLGINLSTQELITPDLEYWQGFIDMLGLILHLRNHEECQSNTWALLLSYYLRGYICNDKTGIENLWQKAKSSGEGLPECLRKCWSNHHAKEPYAAIALTFQACLFLDNDIDRLKLWKEMSVYWINFLKSEKDGHLLSMIDQEIRVKLSPFNDVVSMIQALAYFDLFSSSHSVFKADIKSCGKERLLQIKVEEQNYHLLLPWKFEDAFKHLTTSNNTFFNEIYRKKGISTNFGNLLLKYKPFLSISWDALHAQAHALLNQPDETQQSIGYHLLLCCQHVHPRLEAWPKLYSHLPLFFKSSCARSTLESFVVQLHSLIMESTNYSCPTFDPSAQFVKTWLIDMASKEIVQAKAACELWKHFFLTSENIPMDSLEILNILATHHPDLVVKLADDILTNHTLDFDTRYYVFTHLIKAHTPSDLTHFERVFVHAKSFASIKIPNTRHQFFDKYWKSLFLELNRQKRESEAAELLCALAKNQFFNPDNQDLDSIWLKTCHNMLLTSTLELTGKLAANIYKQRLWDRGWNNEGHIKLLYKLSKSIFLQNEELSKVCLKFACREAKKGSSQYPKICAYVVSHLKEQIISKKISELEFLARNPFKDHISAESYSLLANQVKVMAIENEYKAGKYEAGGFLVNQLDKAILTQEQKDQIAQIQLQAAKKLLTETNYKYAKLVLSQMITSALLTEKHFKEIQIQLNAQLKSKEGVFFVGKLLLDPIYSPLFIHEGKTLFEWQFKCLETLNKIPKSESIPFIYDLLVEFLNELKESHRFSNGDFLNGVNLISAILNNFGLDASMPSSLEELIESSIEPILSRLRKDSQHKALHQLVQLVLQKYKQITLSKNSASDFLWSLQFNPASTESIAHFLLSTYMPEHLSLVVSTIELLIKDRSLSLALDLLKKYEIHTNSLWKIVFKHIEEGKDTHLQQKCWDALQNFAEKKQLLSSEERVHCWSSAISALNKSQSSKIFSALESLKLLEDVFKDNIDAKLLVYKSLVLGSLKHITNAQAQFTQVNVLAALDSSLFDTPFTAEESLSIIKKLSTSSNPDVLHHVCQRLLKHFLIIENKQDQFPANISVVLARLIKEGTSHENNKALRTGITEIFNHIQLAFTKHLELLTLIQSSMKKDDGLSQEFVWRLLNQFLGNERDDPQTKMLAADCEKCSSMLLNILQEFLSSAYQSTIVHLFMNLNYCANILLPKDLTIIRGQCLKLYLKKALQFKSLHFKLKSVSLFNDHAKCRTIDSDQLMKSFSKAIDLTIELNGIAGAINPFWNTYSEMICNLLEIDNPPTNFHQVFELASEKANKKNNSTRRKFIQINMLVFKKIVGLNRHTYSLLFAKGHYLKPDLPYDNLLTTCGFIQSYLSMTHLSEIDAQMFPLLPRYYFQRMALSSNNAPLADNEFKVFLTQQVLIGVAKYEIDIMEIKDLIEPAGSSYNFALNKLYQQAVERVNSSEQLQTVLWYMGKINFSQHQLTFFKLHTRLFAQLKKDPFFVCEIDQQSLCFLFLKNIEQCLQKFDPSSVKSLEAHKTMIQMLFKMAEGFIELFDNYPIEEQHLHLKHTTNFLNLACYLPALAQQYHVFDIEGLNINITYFKLIEKIFRADLKKRKSTLNASYEFPNLDIFELICCNHQGVDKLLRVKTFSLWIKEISKIDSKKENIAAYVEKANTMGLFEGFLEYKKKLE